MYDPRLKTFVTVATLKSFSRAARILFLSQPTVSLQIQSLEEQYGLPLLNREGKEITLTQAGELLYQYASEIIGLSLEAETEIIKLTGRLKGKLVIGATMTIGEYVLPKIVGSFKQQYPEVEILMEVGNTERIVRLVNQGRFDLGIIEGPIKNYHLVKEKFMEDELVLIVPRGHPWTELEAVHFEELCNARLILREPGSGTRQVLVEALLSRGIKLSQLNVYMELGSTEAIKAAVEVNLGVSILSKMAIVKELRLGSLQTVAIKNLRIMRTFDFIYQENYLTGLAKEFIEFCLKWCSN
ncbi:Transcription regulator HTH, LysR [Moorella glycerini]|uniref:HTH-type transcriptional regulator CysL n=1 Tax=Neomoorella stamsii TaxID=1266720 RepID=A0A9X7J639_9FIRM|nr:MULTISPECIES: selenium metabolism-associated LysR family transcriptional regulator [Moorella]PRR76411.1 HTH-type transcriptional regulator CysL [Moorella stamsii]CEP67020.1 Transcription regulator HTH, LysR [Moorella glycerini]